MRVIEEQIVKAIREQRFLSKGRSEFYSGVRDRVEWEGNTCTVKLWGHTIASLDFDNKYAKLSDCGYSTPTTRDRLKAVMSAVNIEGYCHIYKGQMRWVIDEGKQANGWTVRVM